ncbi:helix-turn-helix domain-containing protein [Streptomyces aquilus]|uniref:helix-turn-helix domain-containing protein n=1 Tax=Streptomyces aquilus TaxID=2548456 RepID=UPI0037D43298
MTEPIAARVINELTALRRQCKISAQQLADRMTAAGYPTNRSTIANLENGRRTEISVGHLAFAAQALGADAAAILRRAAPCPQCANDPPTGFVCGTCGSSS